MQKNLNFGKCDDMKKWMAFVLVSACLLCMYGCRKTNEPEPTDFSITEGILDGGADIGVDATP